MYYLDNGCIKKMNVQIQVSSDVRTFINGELNEIKMCITTFEKWSKGNI